MNQSNLPQYQFAILQGRAELPLRRACRPRDQQGGAITPPCPSKTSLALILIAFAISLHAALIPVDLRCDYGVNPLGIDIPQPRLFWKLDANERGQQQSAYEILAASSTEKLSHDDGDLWGSGKINSDQTIQILYCGKPLSSSQQVFWKVRVWDGVGNVSKWSKPATWAMGILEPSDWHAKWISAPDTNFETLILRHEFFVKPGLKRAIASVCGLGEYKLSINGNKAGNDFLSPGWTDYRKTCLYDTRDVRSLLHPGNNAIGIFLGNGMYRVGGTNRFAKFKGSFGPLKVIAQLRLEYEDGSIEIPGTDETWRTSAGPVTFSSIYGGEDFDGRLVQKKWDKTGFDDSQWLPAIDVAGPGGVLRGFSFAAPPIREFEVHMPVSSYRLTNGDVVYDLGQNASYRFKISIKGPRGSRIRIIPAELTHPDGSVNQASMGAGKRGSVWCDFTKGTDGIETWSPTFFYIGCRYVEVQFTPARPAGPLPRLKSIQGVLVHSTSSPAGNFECSNELFNRTRAIIRWAQMNNMVSLMTDCPHRERLGWLEQDHLNGPALRYEFDLAQLFSKQVNDMADAQTGDGLVPNIAPEYVKFKGGFRDSPEWGSSAVLVPWQQYQFDADRSLLERHYDMMARYVAYLGSTASNNIVNHGLGDWYDIGPKAPGIAQLTPIALTATAFYYYDALTLSEIATVLGKTSDARKFSALAETIRTSFNNEFFNATNGTYSTSSQVANAMPLVMGICDSTNRDSVLNAIIADVRAHGNALTAGDVGYQYLLRALADNGRSDVIFGINNQSDKPGYGMQLKRGATSLTEAWDASPNHSQDHFMLGQIEEWFYHDLAGIQSDGPGFKKIVIHPQPVGDLNWVRARYNSIRGKIVSNWKRDGSRFQLDVTIPPNTTATVFVPAKSAADVTESGKPASKSDGITFKEIQGGYAVFEIQSGSYKFEGVKQRGFQKSCERGQSRPAARR